MRQLLKKFIWGQKNRPAQPPSPGVLLSRRRFLLAGAALAYVGAALVVGKIWYGQAARTNWHWFDDRAEWRQMDKMGHAFSSFHCSRLLGALLRWAGQPEAQAHRKAAGLGFLAHAPIEWLDGFMPAYGASWADLLANAAGSGLYYGQAALSPGHRWLKPKFSFAPSPFAHLRPQLLGKNWAEQLLKDYNGQTYWLSLAPSGQMAKAWQQHLPWLRVAVGHGATGMVRAREDQNRAAGHQSRRRFLVGLDLDLAYLREKTDLAPGWEIVLAGLEMYRLPMPTIELGRPVAPSKSN